MPRNISQIYAILISAISQKKIIYIIIHKNFFRNFSGRTLNVIKIEMHANISIFINFLFGIVVYLLCFGGLKLIILI